MFAMIRRPEDTARVRVCSRCSLLDAVASLTLSIREACGRKSSSFPTRFSRGHYPASCPPHVGCCQAEGLGCGEVPEHEPYGKCRRVYLHDELLPEAGDVGGRLRR